MQLFKSNPDGSDQTISELDLTNYGSPAAAVEYGRASSEGGLITLLGQFEQPFQADPGETKPGDPAPPVWTPSILAVFNNGAQIVCYIV